jgi:ABC-type multidrug transport system permease subunit
MYQFFFFFAFVCYTFENNVTSSVLPWWIIIWRLFIYLMHFAFSIFNLHNLEKISNKIKIMKREARCENASLFRS